MLLCSDKLVLGAAECFAFASLISAIDPVSTIAVFSSLGMEPALSTIIQGESVVNDAAAIVLYRMFSALMIQEAGAGTVVSQLLMFLVVFVGAVALGALCGLMLSWVLKRSNVHVKEGETMLILLTSYAAFSFAEACHMSGIVASMSCGMTCAQYAYKNLSAEAQSFSKRVFRLLASVSELLIFFSVGENVFLFASRRNTQRKSHFGFVVATIMLCVVGRALGVITLTFCVNRRRSANKIPFRWQVRIAV